MAREAKQDKRLLPGLVRLFGMAWAALFSFLTSAIMALIALLLFFLYTPAGLQLGLELGREFLPRELAFDRLEGRLAGPLELHQLSFHSDGLRLRLARLRLEWAPAQLLRGKLHVRLLHLERAELVLAAGDPESPPPALPVVELPLVLQIDRLRADGVQIVQEGTSPVALDGLQFSLNGSLDDLRLEGEAAAVSGTDFGVFEAAFAAHWDGRVATLQRLRVAAESGLLVQGRGDWSAVSGESQGIMEWQTLTWPLQGTPSIVSPEGWLSFSGRPDEYRFDLSGRLEGPELPPLTLALNGHGDRRHAESERLALTLLDGQVKGSASIDWVPEVDWRIQLGAADLDPAKRWPEWPGQLSVELSSNGRLGADGLHARLLVDSIGGRLRGYQLQAEAEFVADPDRLRLRRLQLASGESRLRAEGVLDQRWNLDWSLHSADLASLHPDLSGRLEAAGRLRGERLHPRLTGSAKAEGLVLAQQSLDRLQAEVDLDLGPEGRLQARIRGEGLHLGAQRWASMDLDLDGTRERHRLSLAAASPQASIDTRIQAGLGEARDWRGELRALDLRLASWGEWRLERPAGFQLAATGARLDRACLRNTAARFCAQAERTPDSAIRGELQLVDLPLKPLSASLSEGVLLSGTGDADLEFALLESGEMIANGWAEITKGAVDVNLSDAPLRVEFSGSRLEVQTGKRGLRGRLHLPLQQAGEVSARIALPEWSPAAATDIAQPLRGQLQAELPRLDRFAMLLPQLADPRGRAEARVTLAGTLGEPQVEGYARLLDAGFEHPGLGLKVEALALEARNRGSERLVYDGGLRAGTGRLEITGETRLDAAGGWPTRLRLRGEELNLADIPELWLLVSPDLQLALANGRVGVEGEIFVPRARIRPRALPDTLVTASPDLQIVERQVTPRKRPTTAVESQVRLRLGEQVSFDGFGLRGLIRGNLLLADEPGRPTLGNGQLTIEQGRYRAYGQDLEIQQGRLLFANSPVTNPGIAVTARREVGEVEAGVIVSGTLDKPSLRVYANPAMTQSEALSYLLLGRPQANDTSSSERELLRSAANTLATSGGGWLAAELGRQLGLDELSLQSGVENELALHVGTYLSPRLYIQYITELTATSNQVRLRYDLNDKIQIQTETGSVHGADIFYTIEK